MLNLIIPIKKSRPAKLNWRDIYVIIRDSCRIKRAMRRPFPGRYPYASSISHCQLKSAQNDPLRFFVVDREGGMREEGVRLRQATKLKRYFGARTIINPEIIGHGKETVMSKEGCMGFPDGRIRKIKRWEVVECEYYTLLPPFKRRKKFYMYRASIIQHEIDHLNTVDIEQRYRHKIK